MMGWRGRSPLEYGRGDRIDSGTVVIAAIASGVSKGDRCKLGTKAERGNWIRRSPTPSTFVHY
ncbi:MAG: hypothetical protein AAGD25_14855 [Cyanobacteria bacterium P01_F01_bin.150]